VTVAPSCGRRVGDAAGELLEHSSAAGDQLATLKVRQVRLFDDRDPDVGGVDVAGGDHASHAGDIEDGANLANGLPVGSAALVQPPSHLRAGDASAAALGHVDVLPAAEV
jgi:hypothetical protein